MLAWRATRENSLLEAKVASAATSLESLFFFFVVSVEGVAIEQELTLERRRIVQNVLDGLTHRLTRADDLPLELGEASEKPRCHLSFSLRLATQAD